MRKGALALYLLLLLTFASHGIPCAAAARSAMAEEDAAHHRLRPHQHETQGERMQTARKVGRMAGGSGEGSGRYTGGGAADTGPRRTKNGGTVARPASATSALALVFTATALLSTLSF
ncbi:uncharacterized protein LOC119362203 isoform X1 [Triticum dicoccoides]|uniref:uncharacterized protein LOC119362203 isoform X1 n=1 Tax=Triticum dicoccoides TaxID=85692 RepID=UPI00188F1F41|nr:uncharacterized protein LOC119362203 isoform X1 [Triticum dicoccoides]